ncbi:UDP-glucuronosyl/UDP-glucosyltransferase [Artemisia annua]|uniref:UDP-glucuronosyl/UDP-glucosyltransferase n=1 Tax=Artemisia annua TaxID=35608 RepID=A0A2U1MYH9_ARTAN|nr:UDP-glucuronosyl/UDP-glucosyltransferase [Artemisia annua]
MTNTVVKLVFIPAPGMGHIFSAIEMAKLLVNRDQRLSITVLIIKPPNKHREVKAIVVNTFFELETHAINSLSTNISIPPVYPVGPLLNVEAGGGAAGKSSDNDVIGWLEKQPPSSVVFLCFGSMGFFDEIQVKEIANALEHSGHHFLWSLRQPPSDQTSKVPTAYEDPRMIIAGRIFGKDRWNRENHWVGPTSDDMILAHHAIGAFVSHCGWNSILESLWFGVPLATWPIYAEQQLNAFEMVAGLGLAVEIKLDYKKDLFSLKADLVIVSAEEIESGIRRLMEDHELRTKVKEMSKKSRTTVAEGGSSYASVGCLIQDFIRNMT